MNEHHQRPERSGHEVPAARIEAEPHRPPALPASALPPGTGVERRAVREVGHDHPRGEPRDAEPEPLQGAHPQGGALRDLEREVGEHQDQERDQERRHRQHGEELRDQGEAHRGRDLAVGQHGEERLRPLRGRVGRGPEPRPHRAAALPGDDGHDPRLVLAGEGAARAVSLAAGRAEHGRGDVEEGVDGIVLGRSTTHAAGVLGHGAPLAERVRHGAPAVDPGRSVLEGRTASRGPLGLTAQCSVSSPFRICFVGTSSSRPPNPNAARTAASAAAPAA